MNKNLGIIGKKLGNTQFFSDDGTVVRCTVIHVGPVVVLGKRTPEKNGYAAFVLGYGDKREKLVNKPDGGFFKKLGQPVKRTIKEIRVADEDLAKFEIGQTLKPSELFTVGQRVDVQGKSRGRGFTGVMVRWNFKGAATATHGTHEYQRHGGAIGTNMTPGRTLPNYKMPGQYGNETVTIQNIKVAKILDEENLLLIEGAVPGARNGIVTVRRGVKAPPKTQN